MPNFSYAVGVLKAEFCDFMERLVEEHGLRFIIRRNR